MTPESRSDMPAATAEKNVVDLSGQLFNLFKEWSGCDLIVDRELSNPLQAELDELNTQRRTCFINPKRAASPFDQCLMLARLSMHDLPLLERSIDISLDQNTDVSRPTRAIGGWLFSRDASAEQLADHLEKAIIVRLCKAPDALLRLWDPRVIGHLPRILTVQQLASLLGPIRRWCWIDRNGQLQRLEKPVVPAAESIPLPLYLSTEQDAAIDRIAHINILLKSLASLGHRIDPERDAELDAVVLAAIRSGHANPTDMLAYGLHALLVSKTFDAIPEVKQAIAQAHANGLGLCAALDQFDDAFWLAHKAPA